MFQYARTVFTDLTTEKIEHFQHEALKLAEPSIRVVEILPPNADDSNSIITCALREIPLKVASHTCLSYVCGDPNQDGTVLTILVNGRRLSVLPNLWLFLHQARAMNILEPMWIDAISIDQSNLQERNRQVRQMSDIYNLARHVIVYPGPIDWRRVILSPEEAKQAGIDIDLSQAEMNSNHLQLLDHVIAGRICVKRLFYHDLIRKYFDRLWIVQEILLSKNRSVLLGGELMSWDDFVHAMIEHWEYEEKWLTTEQLQTRKSTTVTRETSRAPGLYEDMRPPKFLQLLRLSMTSRDRKLPLPDLLHIVHQSGCSEPRDTVYGLLGLVENGCSVPIDYTRPTENVLLDALELLIPKSSANFSSDFIIPCRFLSFRLDTNLGTLCRPCAASGADLQRTHTLNDEEWARNEVSHRPKSGLKPPSLPIEFMMTPMSPIGDFIAISEARTVSFDGSGYCRQCRRNLFATETFYDWPPITIATRRESPKRLWITLSNAGIRSRVGKKMQGGTSRLKSIFRSDRGAFHVHYGEEDMPTMTALGRRACDELGVKHVVARV